MTYYEAIKYANTVKWKVITCSAGKDCWCRMIVPKDKLFDDNNNEIYIVNSGFMCKEHAKHIVKLHNKNLKK